MTHPTADDLDDLAVEFAATIFPIIDESELADAPVRQEREVSMAALQGYLMGHKEDPVAAVGGAAAWIEGHREQRVRRKVAVGPVAVPKLKKKKSVVVKKDVGPAPAPEVLTPVSAVDVEGVEEEAKEA